VAQKDEEAGGIQRVGRTLEAELVERYVDGSMKHRTFTDVARLVLGRPADRAACGVFWNSIAFANLGPEPRLRTHAEPTTEPDWQGVGQELAMLIAQLDPEVVLVLGDQLWTHLEQEGADENSELGVPLAHAPHPGRAGFDFREHSAKARAAFRKLNEFPGRAAAFAGAKVAAKDGDDRKPAAKS